MMSRQSVQHLLKRSAAAMVVLFVGGPLAAGQTPQAVPQPTYPRTVEGQFGIGFTVLDPDAWAGRTLMDSNTFSHQATVLFLPVRDADARLSVGGELGYQHFFEYTDHGPLYYPSHGYTTEQRALRILGLVRDEPGAGVFVDAGAGVYQFSGKTSFGFTAAIGRMFRVGERVSVPIKARFDYVFSNADGGAIPALALVAGFGYRF